MGACVDASLIGGDTLVCPIIVCCHWSEVQHVVFNVIGHICFNRGSVDVEVLGFLHPVDLIVGPSYFTGEGEIFRMNGNCVVSNHH